MVRPRIQSGDALESAGTSVPRSSVLLPFLVPGASEWADLLVVVARGRLHQLNSPPCLTTLPEAGSCGAI